MSPWSVTRLTGTAAELHAASAAAVADPAVSRGIRILEATGLAIVLGSAQADGVVDAKAAAGAGVAVARRPSGGGAVLVGPGQSAWVDVLIPAGDALWSDDVGRAMWWVGEAWRWALAATASGRSAPLVSGAGEPAVWHGPMVRTAWSDRICFAGLGPGEVTAQDPSGQPTKLVGISQRRTRFGALFQGALAIRWDPADLLGLLAIGEEDRAAAAVDLAPVATGLGPVLAAAAVEAFVSRVSASSGPG